MVGIDLFAGAGGISQGAICAGISVAHAVEADPFAAASYRANHNSVRVFQDDIRKFIPPSWKQRKKPVIVFGGPPCQGFSTSNQRNRTVDNELNWLFKEFLRVVRVANPEWVLLENVSGMQQTEGGIFVDAIEKTLSKYGYDVTVATLKAADYGVPQTRTRLFIIGAPKALRFELPKPFHTEPISAWDAIKDLPRLPSGAAVDRRPYGDRTPSRYARSLRESLTDCDGHLVTANSSTVLKRYSFVPQGGNWADIPARYMRNYTNRENCHTGIYHRLNANQPAITIGNYRKNMLIHPYQDRGLSVREAARIQSFPDGFRFSGSIGYQQQQVGNAVPPRLAQHVFAAVLKAELAG